MCIRDRRHAVRARCRRLESQYEHGVPHGSWNPGWARVDELLSPLPGARGVWWLQAIGYRPREPQDDARSLPANQERVGELWREQARLLLILDCFAPYRPTGDTGCLY